MWAACGERDERIHLINKTGTFKLLKENLMGGGRKKKKKKILVENTLNMLKYGSTA